MQSVLPVFSPLDYLQCQYRADLQVLVSRWLRQPTNEELHQGYYYLLEAAETHHALLWLVDARRRDHASQQNTPWMMEHFLPLLPKRLGGTVYMAYLFMPTHLRELEHDATVPSLSYFDGRGYQVQRFIEEHTAMQWLSECAALQTSALV